MKTFGYEIGMAFQIVDDVLDFTGKQTMVGKPVASDLRQGLVTLPAIYFAESYPGDENLNAYLNGFAGDAEMNQLVESIRNSGAIQNAMEEARAFTERGIKAIVDLPDNEEHRALVELADYIVDRDI